MKIPLIATLFLTGCAVNSGVAPTGPDSYMLSKQGGTAFTPIGPLKADALREASQFCVTQGKLFRTTYTSESKPPYIFGNFPRAEIQFMCLSEGDADLTRPKFRKDADTVIELRN